MKGEALPQSEAIEIRCERCGAAFELAALAETVRCPVGHGSPSSTPIRGQSTRRRSPPRSRWRSIADGRVWPDWRLPQSNNPRVEEEAFESTAVQFELSAVCTSGSDPGEVHWLNCWFQV